MAELCSRSVELDGASIVLRSALAADAEGVLGYVRRAAQTTDQITFQADELPATEAEEAALLAGYARDPSALFLLAVSADGQVVATLSFRAEPRRRGAHAGVFGLLVDAPWRGKGIGRAMIEVLLEWAAAHPVIEKVCLSVFSSNPRAIRLYRRLGFSLEGRRRGQYRLAADRYVDELLMARWVKPRALTASPA